MKKKGLTPKDLNWINSECCSIAKLERHGVQERFLRQEVYMLGLYAFRQFNNAELPEDAMDPGLNYELLTREQS